ncbi:hypothetical protein OAV73_04795 [Flavobacteriaceae bacterium]|nr:hypothetical protein [Flavobacteriaceae bacterium]
MIHSNIKPIGLILILLMISCNSTKLSSNKTDSQYQKEGYTYGVIIPKDNGNCGWIISVAKNINYDPINIEDEKFIKFSSSKETVYFKFLPLRMKNRCKNASPIALMEVVLATN